MRHLVAFVLFATAICSFAAQELSRFTSELGEAREKFVQGKFDEALAALDRVDKASDKTMESLDLRGSIYLEQGKFEDAAKAFEAAQFLKFDAFAPRMHLADALLRQKKFEEARKEYEKLTEVKIPMWPEFARFGVVLTYLGEQDETRARQAVAAIVFPTVTPAYYYAQAAWAFSRGNKSGALKWIAPARKIFEPAKTSWFDRGLYQFGWIKKKPPPAIDSFY